MGGRVRWKTPQVKGCHEPPPNGGWQGLPSAEWWWSWKFKKHTIRKWILISKINSGHHPKGILNYQMLMCFSILYKKLHITFWEFWDKNALFEKFQNKQKTKENYKQEEFSRSGNIEQYWWKNLKTLKIASFLLPRNENFYVLNKISQYFALLTSKIKVLLKIAIKLLGICNKARWANDFSLIFYLNIW